MLRQFKLARQFKNLKVTEAAKLLGVSQPTLSAWESGRKAPSVESLEKMANLYGVTTDFLLGREEEPILHTEKPIPMSLLSIMHGYPVWSAKYGWMIVDVIEKCFITSGNISVAIDDAGELYGAVPLFTESALPNGIPISKSDLRNYDEIWLEPVSVDRSLRNELRGWYKVKIKWVENEFGNRFYLDTYNSKWLAFSEILGSAM